jgi:RND family efflux transporter MFP subunit
MVVAGLMGCNQSEDPQPDAASPGSSTSKGKPASAKATRVETAVIRPSAANLSLSLPGEVEASRDAELAAALGGYIEKVAVKSGDKVKKGQVLALVDSASHSARSAQAKVELDTAERELERVKVLGKALPRAQLDAAQSRYDAAKAAMATASVQASRSVISAPFAGVVARVDAEVGEVAAPGVPLIRVIQIDPIKVTVSLSDRDVLSLREGMKASISTDARANLIEGTVKHINPAADIKTRSFIAEVEVDNADKKLLPGMIASVHVKADVASAQLVIAQDWLVTKPDELRMFVHEDGKAAWRPVEVGPIVRDTVVITDGLKTGDELVITGHRELAAGDTLLVARRGMCCVAGRVIFDGDEPAAPKASADGGPSNGNRAAKRDEPAKATPKPN